LSDPTSGVLLSFMDGICKVNAKGSYCLEVAVGLQFFGLVEDCGVSISPVVSLDSVCPANCPAYLTNSLLGPLGCCAGTFFDSPLLNGIGISKADIVGFLATCKVEMDAECPLAKNVSGNIVVPNLSYGYVIANLEKVTTDIMYDVASIFGAPPSQITLSLSGSTSGAPTGTTGTEIFVSIEPDTDTESGYIASDFNTGVSTGTIIFPIISTYPNAAMNDPTQSMTVATTSKSSGAPLPSSSSSSSTAAGGGTGGVALLKPALSILAALFIVVFTLF